MLEFLKSILSEVGDFRTKEPVGIVSEKLRKAYIDWKAETEELEAEIEFKITRAKRKLERELEEEYEPKFDEMSKKKKEIWQQIKMELGLIGETHLNINTKTGEISQYTDEIDFTKY
jgi:hypothetical protein